MTPSQNCYDLAKRFEGLRLSAYQDAVGVWTIGYGHTGGVEEGMTITLEQAEDLLVSDMNNRAAACVNHWVTAPLTQNQFDALCDFTFNLGCGALQKSELLANINSGNPVTAENFTDWDHAGGVVLPGLLARRLAEQSLFLRQS